MNNQEAQIGPYGCLAVLSRSCGGHSLLFHVLDIQCSSLLLVISKFVSSELILFTLRSFKFGRFKTITIIFGTLSNHSSGLLKGWIIMIENVARKIST